MSKDLWYTIAGGLLGSLIEEGIEEIWPVGELKWTGEISGAIVGLLTSKLTKEEVKNSVEKFILYAYRYINKSKARKINDEELQIFSDNFKTIPEETKREIITNFKELAPYEFSVIQSFLSEMGG